MGKVENKEAKITRYNKTGTEIHVQNIQTEVERNCTNSHTTLQRICTSDFKNDTVVVVNKSGQYRYSFTGQKEGVSSPWTLS